MTKRALPDQEQSVTCPADFVRYILQRRGIELPTVPQTCVISHSQGLLDMTSAVFPRRTIDLGARRPVEIHFFGDDERPSFAMVSSSLGAPMAAVLLEELIALGFSRFVSVGIAGHPTGANGPKLIPGDLVLVNGAVIYEGTSSHYHPAAVQSYPDPELTSELQEVLVRHGLHHVRGSVATTDALYRETESFLLKIVAEGVVAIDMELSALFTVSSFYQRKLAALVYISDIVESGPDRWEMAFVEERITRAEEQIFKVMVDFLGET